MSRGAASEASRAEAFRFFQAVEGDDVARARQLVVERGVDPNVRIGNPDIASAAIHVAVDIGSVNMMRLLVELGADLNAVREVAAENPMDIALRRNNQEMVAALHELGAVRTPTLAEIMAEHRPPAPLAQNLWQSAIAHKGSEGRGVGG